MSKHRYSAPYGSREIYRDGKPFIIIQRARPGDGGYISPVDVDDFARRVLELLQVDDRGYPRRNPPLVVFANPGNRRTQVKSVCVNRVGFLSHEVHSVAYVHCDDGKPYQHDFERPTDLIACKTDDGRKVLVILNPDGEPVWEDFS